MPNPYNKQGSMLDGTQALAHSFNDVNATVSVDGFLVQKVGNQVAMALATTNVSDDTEIYSFYDNALVSANLLYEITIVYTDNTRAQMITATRSA